MVWATIKEKLFDLTPDGAISLPIQSVDVEWNDGPANSPWRWFPPW
jgi:hypothetical protein